MKKKIFFGRGSTKKKVQNMFFWCFLRFWTSKKNLKNFLVSRSGVFWAWWGVYVFVWQENAGKQKKKPKKMIGEKKNFYPKKFFFVVFGVLTSKKIFLIFFVSRGGVFWALEGFHVFNWHRNAGKQKKKRKKKKLTRPGNRTLDPEKCVFLHHENYWTKCHFLFRVFRFRHWELILLIGRGKNGWKYFRQLLISTPAAEKFDFLHA